MAKGNRNSGIFKQDQVISQFSKDIRQNEKRNWSTISEKCTKQTETKTVSKIRVSQYNPSNPLNGSKSWTKEQTAAYRTQLKAKQKAEKVINDSL